MNRVVVLLSAVFLSCCTAAASGQAAAPASSPAPANVTTSESPAIREFQKIEDSWADSMNQHDQYGLELVLSPLFVDVSASGDITTRNQQVTAVITSEDKSIHLDQRVITVRMLGDVAVANGTYTLHRKISSGPVDEKGVFTHVLTSRLGVSSIDCAPGAVSRGETFALTEGDPMRELAIQHALHQSP